MVQYKPVKELRLIEGMGTVEVYGIIGTDTETGTEIVRVSNVFIKKEEAEALARLCTRLKLSPLHLAEVAEDVLVR